jgi:two-component system, OmpR family, sensor kinase
MSLRLRLTILYSALSGGILLVFGVLVFFLVNLQMRRQVDDRLLQTYKILVTSWKVGPTGQIIGSVISEPDLSTDISFQVWDQHGRLETNSPNLGMVKQPLDAVGFQAGVSAFRDSYISWGHLRVLTVPLEAGGRPIGTLQVGANMNLIDLTRHALLDIIIIITIVAILLAAGISWFIIGQALAPLSSITETALKISRADDLSQRIPVHRAQNDEIGRLIGAFNETLERLEHIFTSQQRFLADVSHELRTPLTVIKGNVNLLRRIKQVDEESLETIEDESDRLTRLVGNLLLEAQVESGKLPLFFLPTELDTLVLEVFKEMRVIARDRVNIKLTEIDQIMVNGDRDRLKQVLINLVSNAIKYTPLGGYVYLSLGRAGDNARVIIRDTGQGISSEDLPHIFERFFRAEKSRTRSKTSGFGLGLSIAAWIVDHHGGRIEVDSAENKGSTFCIYLPILKSVEIPLKD